MPERERNSAAESAMVRAVLTAENAMLRERMTNVGAEAVELFAKLLMKGKSRGNK